MFSSAWCRLRTALCWTLNDVLTRIISSAYCTAAVDVLQTAPFVQFNRFRNAMGNNVHRTRGFLGGLSLGDL